MYEGRKEEETALTLSLLLDLEGEREGSRPNQGRSPCKKEGIENNAHQLGKNGKKGGKHFS